MQIDLYVQCKFFFSFFLTYKIKIKKLCYFILLLITYPEDPVVGTKSKSLSRNIHVERNNHKESTDDSNNCIL